MTSSWKYKEGSTWIQYLKLKNWQYYFNISIPYGLKSHGKILGHLAEKVAVIDCLSGSFHSRDNKMIRQISVCEGRKGWSEFGLSAKQESEHGEQSQKPAQPRQWRQCQVCSLHIHVAISWHTLCLCRTPQDF